MFHNRLEVESIEVKDAVKLDANHMLVVYKQEAGHIERRVVEGPTIFIPSAHEWWAWNHNSLFSKNISRLIRSLSTNITLYLVDEVHLGTSACKQVNYSFEIDLFKKVCAFLKTSSLWKYLHYISAPSGFMNSPGMAVTEQTQVGSFQMPTSSHSYAESPASSTTTYVTWGPKTILSSQ